MIPSFSGESVGESLAIRLGGMAGETRLGVESVEAELEVMKQRAIAKSRALLG
ncbi:MAG TPA: hypothetical protein V6D11_19110 [Waterburya sp.]